MQEFARAWSVPGLCRLPTNERFLRPSQYTIHNIEMRPAAMFSGLHRASQANNKHSLDPPDLLTQHLFQLRIQ